MPGRLDYLSNTIYQERRLQGEPIVGIISHIDKKKLQVLTRLIDKRGRPTRNALADISKNLRLIELNLKALGYDLAMRLAHDLPVRSDTVATHVGLRSKASTQADIESEWSAHWAGQLKTPVMTTGSFGNRHTSSRRYTNTAT
jgi:hypothetical protein